jgi:hypothetical protein
MCIRDRLTAFIEWKQRNPFNGAQPASPGFGDNDKKFKSTGNFGIRIANISHAHLTHNLSIIYRIENNALSLYGIYTHDELGVGNPPNIQRQQQIATRWSNMKLDSGDSSALTAKAKQDLPAGTKQSTVDYTPKPKQPIVKSAPKPPEVNQLAQIAKQTDSLWPQRNFYNLMQNAKSKVDQLAVLNGEAKYLHILKQKHRLFPNQEAYAKGLQALYNYLTQR